MNTVVIEILPGKSEERNHRVFVVYLKTGFVCNAVDDETGLRIPLIGEGHPAGFRIVKRRTEWRLSRPDWHQVDIEYVVPTEEA